MASLFQVRVKYVSTLLSLSDIIAFTCIAPRWTRFYPITRRTTSCFRYPRYSFSDRTKDTKFTVDDDFGDFESYRKRKEQGGGTSHYYHDYFRSKSHGKSSTEFHPRKFWKFEMFQILKTFNIPFDEQMTRKKTKSIGD